MKNFLLILLLLLCSCNDTKQNEIDELQCRLSLLELEIAERDTQIKTLEDRIDILSDEIANNELAKKQAEAIFAATMNTDDY
ncbi:hypothetical protein [Alistipes sp.]|uniref:hypothetical protein n=1 Tax=Alistipes sp. TaxID=1872444 RepID=UPI0025C330CB|nr:hypothetical protein [Alistipes sp.]